MDKDTQARGMEGTEVRLRETMIKTQTGETKWEDRERDRRMEGERQTDRQTNRMEEEREAQTQTETERQEWSERGKKRDRENELQWVFYGTQCRHNTGKCVPRACKFSAPNLSQSCLLFQTPYFSHPIG